MSDWKIKGEGFEEIQKQESSKATIKNDGQRQRGYRVTARK